MKVLIYGSGLTGRQVYKDMKDRVDVIGFLDGNPDKKRAHDYRWFALLWRSGESFRIGI